MLAMKGHIQSLLRTCGVYERLKASALYDIYWTIADVSLVHQRRAEQVFYRCLLSDMRQGDLVFDVGANHGNKTGIFLSIGARVIAVEPDHVNRRIIEERFLRYRFHRKPVIIVGKALGENEGTATMWIDEPGSAKNTFSSKWVDVLRRDDARFGQTLAFSQRETVPVTTLDALISMYGRPAFIKIDVEGYESSVLDGLHQLVPCLSFEVNLPEFRDEGLLCLKRLASLASHGTFNFHVTCQRGLELSEWRTHNEFAEVLSRCQERSIEIVWNTTAKT